MIKTAVFLFIVSLIAAALGFTGIAGAAAGLAKIIFAIALIGALIVLALVVMGVKAIT